MSYNSSNEKRLHGNPGLVRTVFPLMGIVNMLFYLCVVVAEAQECQGFKVCMIQGNVYLVGPAISAFLSQLRCPVKHST